MDRYDEIQRDKAERYDLLAGHVVTILDDLCIVNTQTGWAKYPFYHQYASLYAKPIYDSGYTYDIERAEPEKGGTDEIAIARSLGMTFGSNGDYGYIME